MREEPRRAPARLEEPEEETSPRFRIPWLGIAVFAMAAIAVGLWLMQLNFQTQFGTNYNLAFASYLLALLPILLFYLICQKHILNGVVNGAVK